MMNVKVLHECQSQKYNDVLRYSGAFPRIVLNIWVAF